MKFPLFFISLYALSFFPISYSTDRSELPMIAFSWWDDIGRFRSGETATIKVKVLENGDKIDTNIFHPILTVNGKEGNSSYVSTVLSHFKGDFDNWKISFTPIRVGLFNILIDEDRYKVSDSSLHFQVEPGNMYVFVSSTAVIINDDTIIFNEGENDALWSLKAILKGSELISGLKVNFCSLPFKLLGVIVGDSPGKESMWKEVSTEEGVKRNPKHSKQISMEGVEGKRYFHWFLDQKSDSVESFSGVIREGCCSIYDCGRGGSLGSGYLELEPRILEVPYELVWTEDPGEGFSVRSCAEFLRTRDIRAELNQGVREALFFLWKLSAPSKDVWLKIFASRLPIRDQLRRRRIVVNDRDSCCMFCFREEENFSHLFDTCNFTRRIWDKVVEWIGGDVDLSAEELSDGVEYLVDEECDYVKHFRSFLCLGNGFDLLMFPLPIVMTKAGNFSLRIKGGNQTLNGSPLPLKVNSEVIDVSKCVAKWKIEHHAWQLSSKMEIFIHQLDQYGNLVSVLYPFDVEVVERDTNLSIPGVKWTQE
ncbi:unnamed protein product [Vicia faba]|uniref:Reverse transcriptase zinc-binding domain-containing protein n=1 Tax=Vicia faba TaxID=3906 RepID=A0AAV0YXC7_VICFA|nr:unnamed protein product [Vicia faba]